MQSSESLPIQDRYNKEKNQKALTHRFIQLRKICNHSFMLNKLAKKLSQYFNYINAMCLVININCALSKFELLSRILPKLKATNYCFFLLFYDITRGA
jgi:hypothetical protein